VLETKGKDHIASWVEENIPPAERDRFKEMAEGELLSLHEGNFARYQIRPSEFSAWRQYGPVKPRRDDSPVLSKSDLFIFVRSNQVQILTAGLAETTEEAACPRTRSSRWRRWLTT